jgi:hypothetical protein
LDVLEGLARAVASVPLSLHPAEITWLYRHAAVRRPFIGSQVLSIIGSGPPPTAASAAGGGHLLLVVTIDCLLQVPNELSLYNALPPVSTGIPWFVSVQYPHVPLYISSSTPEHDLNALHLSSSICFLASCRSKKYCLWLGGLNPCRGEFGLPINPCETRGYGLFWFGGV